jgi:hypothetical protein
MYLKRKLEELQAFVDKTVGVSQTARLTIEEYLTKWGADLRTELGLSFQAGATIGISCDPSIQLSQLPPAVTVRNGLYTSFDGKMKVEVIGQDPMTGMVQLEMRTHDVPDGCLAAISADLFIFFFCPNDVVQE